MEVQGRLDRGTTNKNRKNYEDLQRKRETNFFENLSFAPKKNNKIYVK